ncbi:DUF4232 domain-containing protein [Streptomyces sp. NPDC049040]|uniref:DUF4232 domain-containing protein n=1 Tax=Streptomyces sp. NPDC049040 TaxID=3365593 RepID=UPI003718027C
MGTRKIRRGAPVLLLATAGLALAACGPSDDSGAAGSAGYTSDASSSASAAPSAPAGTPDSTPATTAQPSSPAAAGTPAATAGGAGGSTTPACATSRLKVTAADKSSGAGSTTFQLVFQNTGSTPCALRGYPGVSFVKAHNVQLGKAAARTGAATTVVTLIPNAHAYADVRTVNGQGGYDPGQCDLTPVPALRIYPPNQTASVNIPWNTSECVGSGVQNLRVGPVHSDR